MAGAQVSRVHRFASPVRTTRIMDAPLTQDEAGVGSSEERLQDAPPDSYVDAQCTIMLYQHAWLMSFVVGLCASSFTAYMFLRQVAPDLVFAWLGFFWLVLCVRIGLILAFKRVGRPVMNALPRWSRYYTVSSWFNGLAWGFPAVWLVPEDLVLVFFYALVISGFVAGAVPGLSFKIKAFYGYSFLSIAPLAVKIFRMGGEAYFMIGVLSVLFVIINTASARISNARIRKQVLLEYENRLLVQKLKKEKERAEAATLAKSRFLAAASHDLRQPLHALGLFVDHLDADRAPGASDATINNIRTSTENIVGLLNGLLDISRLDAGAENAEVKPFPMQRVLDQLELNYKGAAQEKNLTLRIRACDAWVQSDANMVSRILGNILVNAIKYTAEGGVLVACRGRADRLWVEIHDTGEGIESVNLDRIFEEFYQVNNPARDRSKGLGLGLAIVRRLVALLEGELEIHSIPGRGTRFRLVLPRTVARTDMDEPPPQYVDDVAGALVLVVDDDKAIRTAMETLLLGWSCTPLLAGSEEDLWQAMQKLDRHPDLVIMDFRLSGGASGVQLMTEINSVVGTRLPAIFITGETAPGQLREVQESGYVVLHKPVSAAALRSAISYYRNNGSAQTGVAN